MDSALISQLHDIRSRAQKLTAGLSSEELAHRPDPTQWSIVECLAHLNATAAEYHPLIDAAIRRGREGKVLRQGPFKPGWLGGLLKWMAEPPPKFRMTAPKSILPPSSIKDCSQVVAEFMRVQDEWERLVRECDGLDLKKVKCDIPFRPLPRLRLAAPIPWMLAHERRHLLQAEKVKQQLAVKAASA